jgi:hypothetical protein
MIKTILNFKLFGEEISQKKIDCLHIYDLNLLKFAFSIFKLKFSNIHKKSGKYDTKLDQILSYVVKTLF